MARLNIVNVTRRLRRRRRNQNNGIARGARLNVVNNPPRSIPRPKVNFDGQFLNGTQFFSRELAVANAVSHVFMLDTSTITQVSGAAQVDSMARSLYLIPSFYQEFRYTKVQLNWIPHVSPGSNDGGSPCYIGYVDNPEIISNITSGTITTGTILNGVKGLRGMRSFNAWQPFTYNVPLTRRLPWFNVNTNEVATDVNIAERSIQGAIVFGSDTISAAADIGVWRATYTIQLRGLTITFGT
jgi:hypothetical protein